jgi:hypothetical protein
MIELYRQEFDGSRSWVGRLYNAIADLIAKRRKKGTMPG